MLSEHNPIAELIHQVQQKWIDDVSAFPELKLVRWIIKPEEARLFEGFLKLESTEHGAIPEVMMAMLTPFKNENAHSFDLVTDWKKAFQDDIKTQEKLVAKNLNNAWNKESFFEDANAPDDKMYHRLLNMLSSFHASMMQKEMRLVVAFFPYSIYDMDGYKRWLTRLLQQEIPAWLSFMVFDHVGENYFDSLFRKYPDVTKSLHINLDMDGAVSKIAKMGNPHLPEVKLRECILEMGQSVQKKDQDRLHEWGEKALLVTQQSNSKSMYATAHIVYAGMLFNFKQYEKIDSLLDLGLGITRKGLALNDDACKPLLIQYYAYLAASRQLQKRSKEAIHFYEKQGDAATEYQLHGMALTPYQQAYTLSKKKLPERYDELIQKAFIAGGSLTKEEQTSSSFPAIAYDYLQWFEARKGWQEVKQKELELEKIFGAGWKERAKNPAAPFTTNQKNSIIPV